MQGAHPVSVGDPGVLSTASLVAAFELTGDDVAVVGGVDVEAACGDEKSGVCGMLCDCGLDELIGFRDASESGQAVVGAGEVFAGFCTAVALEELFVNLKKFLIIALLMKFVNLGP